MIHKLKSLLLCCAANERTFLHWMNMSVTIGSISAALLGKEIFLGLLFSAHHL